MVFGSSRTSVNIICQSLSVLLRERGHWGDKDVDGMILRWISMKLGGGGGHGDWMEVAQDRDRWQALGGTVRNFGFHKCREFLD
jgi:hypothetical protein